jgi:endonuclease/exonuclease/phosphatase family metal-dependent hydrolase
VNRSVITVATYNVHAFVGLDGRRDQRRTLAVIEELDADVVALQEVLCPADPDRLNALENTFSELGYHCLLGPTLTADSTSFGNVLLVRGTVATSRSIDLALPGREPRAAILAELQVREVDVCVAASHFGLSGRERNMQTKRLIEALDGVSAPIVVVAGDFNFWFAASRPLMRMERRFGRTPRPRTFPTRRPLFALDRIWVDPVETLLQTRIHSSALARVASDHLPLIAEIAANAAP